VKYNPFHLLDWNATILPLLNENFGQLKRLLEKGHKASHEKGGVDEINVTGLKGVLADKQLSDWQVLAEVEVASDCDYVDFTGLDINRDWEYYLDATIKNPTDSNVSYYLFVEEDYTLTNYRVQYLFAGGTTIAGERLNTPEIGAVYDREGTMCCVRMIRDPDGYFRFTSLTNRSILQILVIYAGSKTAPVSNITSLRVSANVSGGIGAGSRFILARPRS